MRTAIAALTVFLVATAAANAQPADREAADAAQSVAKGSPDELLQRGQANYRAGKYAEAVNDLRAASDALLTPEQMRAYVNTGKFESLPKFETAVVYLAMAYAKLGRDSEVSEQIHRLHTAEAIQPTYAKLPLTADVADFEKIAARVAPNAKLPQNAALAALQANKPAPTQVAEAKPEPKLETKPESKPAPPAPAPEPQPKPQPAAAEQEKIVAERVAAERAAIERETAQKIASVQQEAERSIEERVAQERTAIQKAAQEQIAAAQAAAQRDADAKVAAARDQAQREADAKVAAETAAAKKRADEEAAQRIAEIRAATDRAAAERIASARTEAEKSVEERVAAERAARTAKPATRKMAAVPKGSEASLIRQADALAARGELDQANAIYVRVASSAGASREAIAAAATGLYRTSDFADAVDAFLHLSAFARGEEDLRYYNAVALYETGHYEQAKKELACALPYLQATDDVVRYREKIEQTADLRQ